MTDTSFDTMGTFTDNPVAYILVFKTNIRLKKDIKTIASLLNDHSSVLNWNVDLNDIDKVLRIESTINNIKTIIPIIRQAGYLCEELPG